MPQVVGERLHLPVAIRRAVDPEKLVGHRIQPGGPVDEHQVQLGAVRSGHGRSRRHSRLGRREPIERHHDSLEHLDILHRGDRRMRARRLDITAV